MIVYVVTRCENHCETIVCITNSVESAKNEVDFQVGYLSSEKGWQYDQWTEIEPDDELWRRTCRTENIDSSFEIRSWFVITSYGSSTP